MLAKIKFGAIAILLLCAVIIAFQNRESVETTLLFATVEMPRAALLFVTLAIGFAGGVLTTWAIVSRANQDGKPDSARGEQAA